MTVTDSAQIIFGVGAVAFVAASILTQLPWQTSKIQKENIQALKEQAEIHENKIAELIKTDGEKNERIKALEAKVETLSTIPLEKIEATQNEILTSIAKILETQNTMIALIGNRVTDTKKVKA